MCGAQGGWLSGWMCLCARVKFRIILLSCFSVKLGMQHLLKKKKKDFSQFLNIYFLEKNKL